LTLGHDANRGLRIVNTTMSRIRATGAVSLVHASSVLKWRNVSRSRSERVTPAGVGAVVVMMVRIPD
jgi:hypothetical protein